MNDYNNKSNDYFFESLDEDNFQKNIFEYYCPLYIDEEEDDLIFTIKDININNNLSKLDTCEYSPNMLCEIENVKINDINNNNISALQKTKDSNYYVLTQAELFFIPSVNFNNSFNQEKKFLGRKKKILVLLFKVKEINFQKII